MGKRLRERKKARSETDKWEPYTGHQEPQNFTTRIHFKPHNKLEMKTQKKVVDAQ